MKRLIVALTVTLLLLPALAGARVVRVRRTGPHRVRVTVRPGFPIRRALPDVVVRGPVVRVAPHAYLAPVAFAGTVVVAPARGVWSASEELERGDGWTDFAIDVDRHGNRLFLGIDQGAAQISFAEVVFDNGETQVVDFNDRVYANGNYSLLDFRNGRKVDHVRIVAKPETAATSISVRLVE